MGRWGDGEMGRWGDGGEMGRWGDGEMGRWGDGWGDEEMGRGPPGCRRPRSSLSEVWIRISAYFIASSQVKRVDHDKGPLFGDPLVQLLELW